MTSTPTPPPPKPGKIQAIAIFALVDGILNLAWGVGLGGGLVLFGVTACCAPVGAYPIVLGVLEIVYAAKLLPARPRDVPPNRALAVMQIVNIVLGNALSPAAGIVTLTFLDDPEVQAWFASTSTARPPSYLPEPPEPPAGPDEPQK